MTDKRRGFIAVDRGIFDHPLFARDARRLVAWERMIAAAAWEPRGARGPWGVVHLERGQLATSVRALGTAWGWPKSNVARFLDRLFEAGMISLASPWQPGTVTGTVPGTVKKLKVSIVRICNYDKFHPAKKSQDREAGQYPGQYAGQSGQESLPFAGVGDNQPLEPLQPLKQKKEVVDKIGEKGRRSSAPSHGAKGRGMVWWTFGTHEYRLYADDFKEATGSDPLPKTYPDGGKGRWFRQFGEKPIPARTGAAIPIPKVKTA